MFCVENFGIARKSYRYDKKSDGKERYEYHKRR